MKSKAIQRIDRQAGVSLITAVFLITGLALLGALMTRLTIMQSTETINEWYSAQALYAAESGLDWAAQDILFNAGAGITTNAVVTPGTSWVTTTVTQITAGNRTLYTITSTGTAGGAIATPRVQRQLEIQFMP